MAGLDDLSRGELEGILKRLRALETAAPLQNASIGAGGVRVHSGGVITIQNGGLYVTGTAEIIGTLIASGIIDFTGDVTISGPLNVTGLMTLAGDLVVASGGKITAGTIELNPDGSAKFGTMTISPTGKITSGSAEINPDGSVKFGTFLIDTAGKVTLANDLNVTTGGKIVAGNTTISPSASNGGVEFVSGGGVGGNGGSVVVKGSSNAGLITGTSAALFAGATQLTVGDGSVVIDGLPEVSGVTSNLYMDPATRQVKRIV